MLKVWFCRFNSTIGVQPRTPETTSDEGYDRVYCGPTRRCTDGCGWYFIERDPEDQGGSQPKDT